MISMGYEGRDEMREKRGRQEKREYYGFGNGGENEKKGKGIRRAVEIRKVRGREKRE